MFLVVHLCVWYDEQFVPWRLISLSPVYSSTHSDILPSLVLLFHTRQPRKDLLSFFSLQWQMNIPNHSCKYLIVSASSLQILHHSLHISSVYFKNKKYEGKTQAQKSDLFQMKVVLN